MQTTSEIIDEIERIRARNNASWMNLVRLAWELDPERARKISEEITGNDAKLLELSKTLATPESSSSTKRVLIPGGGVLHTYAVKEAKALGLVPVVSDVNPECPCAKVPGVEFHSIDCYDVESHLELAAKLGGSLVGAFCAGAETHEVVAAVAGRLGTPWVSRETSRLCRDKFLMKERLLEAGIPTALRVEKPPFIVKERFGSGSRGVRRVLDEKSLVGQYPPSLLLTEEILEGPEQSVEILINPDGMTHWINIVDRHFAWVDDQPLEWGHTNPSSLGTAEKHELYMLAERTAKAFGADVGFFKIDTIWTQGGPKVLECTPRLSGGFDSQLSTPISSGRNLIRYGLQLACRLELDHLLRRSRRHNVTTTIIHRPELASAQ